MTDEAKELWGHRIRLLQGEPEVATEAGEMTDPWPDLYRVTDLPKTEFERAAIAETVEALNKMRQVFGLPAVRFSADRVHILTKEEFRQKVVRIRAHGKSNLGHVYLWRGWEPWLTVGILAHELVHAVSYLWIDLRLKAKLTDDGLKLPMILQRRSGMVLIDPSYHTLLPHFHGLNEAATEFAAITIRQLIAKQTTLLDQAGRESLNNLMTSPPLIALFDQLITLAAAPHPDNLSTLKKLFTDLMTGTDTFLAALEPRLPGATEVLRRTGARPFELLNAAEELGLDDQAGYIKQFVE